jgi:hypothetical protein
VDTAHSRYSVEEGTSLSSFWLTHISLKTDKRTLGGPLVENFSLTNWPPDETNSAREIWKRKQEDKG